MPYKIPIPPPRGMKASFLDPNDLAVTAEIGDQVRDMFLYALFARISANDNENWEFETKFDPKDNHIELQISEKFISIIESVTKGDDFNRYIRWLIDDAVTDITNGLLWRLVDGSDDTITTAFKAIFEKSASYNSTKDVGDSGTAAEVNWCIGNKQKILMTDDATLTFVDPPGPASLQLIMTQGGAGNNDPTFPSNVYFPNGTQPGTSNAVGAIDIWSFLYDGTNYYATRARNFQPL